DYLRRGQEQIVLRTAQGLATALNERPELFDESNYSPARHSEDLYVYPIFSRLSLDDSTLIDWGAYQQYEVEYGVQDTLITPLNATMLPRVPLAEESNGKIPEYDYAPNSAGIAATFDRLGTEMVHQAFRSEHDRILDKKKNSLSFRNMVGEYNGSLYAYFKVRDDSIVYRSRDALSVHRSDFLQIAMLNRETQQITRYVVAPHEPEFLYPFRVNPDYSEPVYEDRISGQWYETDGGYEVELQIPMDMLEDRLGFAIFDIDDPVSRNVNTVVATYDSPNAEGLGSLRLPTPEIDRIVAGMGHNNSRIQVVDRSGRVLLTVGDIQSATGLQVSPGFDEPVNKYWYFVQDRILNPLYYRILTKPSNDFIDELYTGVTREGAHIDSALSGQSYTQFRTLLGTETRILEAAHPILANGEVMGALLVDQNMNNLRTFRNQALETLFNTLLAVMLIVTFGLFFFASRISNRIRVLRNQAEGIIDESGRIQNTIVASRNSDEIGDLSRSFASIVERLTQHTSYLENMASRLSHELRTPVTVVRSSIENLGMTNSQDESRVYIERAEEGINRLNLILTNMSEATRLEQMLQTSEKEKIDLVKVVRGCVEGYRLAYPQTQFELDTPNYAVHVNGVPEYIAQLLDKLIANAVEFSYPDRPVRIFCRTLRDHAVVKVFNDGPYLPEHMKDRLFDSMISVRPQEKQKQPHLGMGLHIARLITEFHGGQIRAENCSDAEGVVITVVFPLFYR
ncbi:MAG: proteobacterial dedicated sortase system histidine kinase, partial [Gammaproteobacteria bacterium]